MSFVMNLFLHGLLLGSLAAFLVVLVMVVLRTTHPIERLIRASALFSGALVVLGAQAAGVGFAQFLVQSLSGVRPTPGLGFVSVALPGMAGVAMGWYLTRSLRRSENIAVRILGFTGMLAAVQFAQIYAIAAQSNGFEIGIAAVPNIAFVVGITLYVMLRYDPTEAHPASSVALRSVLDRVSRKAAGPAAAPTSPMGASARSWSGVL